MVDSTKALCPLFDEIWILIPGDLWTKCEILIRYRSEENDLTEQLIKLKWVYKGVVSIHLLHEGFKFGRWLNSQVVIYFFNDKVT